MEYGVCEVVFMKLFSNDVVRGKVKTELFWMADFRSYGTASTSYR